MYITPVQLPKPLRRKHGRGDPQVVSVVSIFAILGFLQHLEMCFIAKS
jgi:hypothetical protein